MKQPAKKSADPEDDLARISAEATNDATPEKALYDSSERRKQKLNRARQRQSR